MCAEASPVTFHGRQLRFHGRQLSARPMKTQRARQSPCSCKRLNGMAAGLCPSRPLRASGLASGRPAPVFLSLDLGPCHLEHLATHPCHLDAGTIAHGRRYVTGAWCKKSQAPKDDAVRTSIADGVRDIQTCPSLGHTWATSIALGRIPRYSRAARRRNRRRTTRHPARRFSRAETLMTWVP